MKKLILSALSAGLLFASAPAAPASAAVAADINLHFGNTPRYYFARQPRTILIPDTRVYYVSGLDDYDMFQCDGMWYIDDGGYWYSAPSYRGPFVSVSYQSVPNVIMNVPGAYAHQPYRPGVWRSSRNYGGGYGGSYGGGYGDGNVYSRGGNGGYNGGDSRWQGRQDSNQRWQDRQRSDRTWNRDRGDNQDQGGWNNGRGHGNGHGNGKNQNNGRGHGRGHDRGDD